MKPPSITNSVPVTVAAYDKALAEGVGAVTVDGKMIDVPIVKRARLLLERESAIAAREASISDAAAVVS
jgi:citrate lyase beta subunit